MKPRRRAVTGSIAALALATLAGGQYAGATSGSGGRSAAGFGSADVMRRAFVRLLGITPRRYREVAEPSTSD